MSRQPHPLASTSQILSTPSAKDGVPKELEDDLRVAGCMMIQEAGIMLGLPQSTMATAQVIFHRFFFVSSMLSFGVTDISVSALYLSTKLNETPIRLRDLINTYIFLNARIKHLLSLPVDQRLSIQGESSTGGPSRLGYAGQAGSADGSNGSASLKGKEKERNPVWDGFMFDVPGFHDEVFWEWKDVITVSEMQILKRLGFNMQVDLPYSHAVNYLKILDLVFEEGVAQMSWSILNDALLTPLYAIHPPHVLACTAILLTTRLLRIPLPTDWHILFDVDYEDLWSSCGMIMQLWRDWGMGKPHGGVNSGDSWSDDATARTRENRWRRSWILMDGRKAVRRWVEENDRASQQDA